MHDQGPMPARPASQPQSERLWQTIGTGEMAAALRRARARWLRWPFADAILRGDDLTASHLGRWLDRLLHGELAR